MAKERGGQEMGRGDGKRRREADMKIVHYGTRQVQT
jgi:hypothetical protein